MVAKPEMAATEQAFALWCHGDSAIVTWGHADFGGDSSGVQDQLRGVKQIQATSAAFAAILADGSVVTWGAAGFGGDCSAVHDQLRGVQQISGHTCSICCDSGRWISRDLGCCTLWWRLFRSS